jgi:hypothetical protein
VGHAVTDCVLVSKVTSSHEGKVEGNAAEVRLGPPASVRTIVAILYHPKAQYWPAVFALVKQGSWTFRSLRQRS